MNDGNIKIKRYVVFAGEHYYPSGGWGDYRGSFDTLEEAQALIGTLGPSTYDWAHVVDLETGYESTLLQSGRWS